MKKFDICGFGNALVDLLFECSELEFQALGVKKGGMNLVNETEQRLLLGKLGAPVRMASGGSVANSVALAGQLGSRAALLCSLAKDEHGDFFSKDLALLGVEAHGARIDPTIAQTGSSLVVVTPDAERTMSTCLGASARLDTNAINLEVVVDSKWLFIEGYVVANSDEARAAILRIVETAKLSGTKVALTMSDAFVVNCFREFLDQLLPQIDLIFCNEVEAEALSGCGDVESSFEYLRGKFPGIVVTAGPRGAYVSLGGDVGHVAAIACTPVDLTGAGDAFAGAFLQGLCGGLRPFEASRKGCFFASKVIQQWGARLRGNIIDIVAEYQL